MEITKDLFTKADWKVLFDALKAKTTAGELHWYPDPHLDEDEQTSYLADLSRDMCVYVVRTASKNPRYELGAQQIKRGLWGVLDSEEVLAGEGIELQELFNIVEAKIAEPDLQLQNLMKEEFLVDLMGALDKGPTDEPNA